jgi:hypothetical protein
LVDHLLSPRLDNASLRIATMIEVNCTNASSEQGNPDAVTAPGADTVAGKIEPSPGCRIIDLGISQPVRL